MDLAMGLGLMSPLYLSPGGEEDMPPSWTAFTHNLPSTPEAINNGAQVTAGANDTKGTVVDLLGSALTHDVELLYIGISGFVTSASNASALLDIMVDPAGGTDWSVLIPNLLAGWSDAMNVVNNAPPPRNYYFPIQIPSGATIGARAQTALGSDLAGRVLIYAIGGNADPGSWWAGTSVEAIGIDTANSIGQMHTAGNSGSYSSWTNLGSTVSSGCNAVQFAVQGENDASATSSLIYQFELGVSNTAIAPPIVVASRFNESIGALPTMTLFRSIPSGAQLQIRGKCSGTAQPMDVAAWVVS